MPVWTLHDDGSFDMAGKGWKISGAFPHLDGEALHPVRVDVSRGTGGGRIDYQLTGGCLALGFGTDAAGLVLRTTWRRDGAMPVWVEPVGHAAPAGLTRCFRQGLGMGGPSGFCDLPPAETINSYTVTGLVGDAVAVVLYTDDATRFVQQSRLERLPLFPDRLTLSAGFRTEAVGGAGEVELPPLYIREAADVWTALQGAAVHIAEHMGARARQPASYHWCSWYYLYHNLSEPLLREYLAGFNALKPRVPLQTIQIDAGYFPSPGDWLEPNALWPSGLEGAFRLIHEAGYRPGIWIAPFMVGNRSRVFREHPDWILRDPDGRPNGVWRIYNEPKVWGYRDEELYRLDTSHPDAMAYLDTVFTTLRQWGAGFFKTDFMFMGLVDSTTVRRHVPGRTSVEYFRDVLAMIRRCIGEENFWLGCIAPFAPFIGYADAMRIGGDVGASWEGGFGPKNMLAESLADQYFNNVWWQNDPDAILVRDFHLQLTDDEIHALALWQGILGGTVNTSDPLHEIAADRLALWRFLEPGDGGMAMLPDWDRTGGGVRYAVRHYADQDAWAVLVFNASDDACTVRLDLARLTGVARGTIYTWGPTRPPQSLGVDLTPVITVPQHAARLYYLSGTGTPPPPEMTLGGRT